MSERRPTLFFFSSRRRHTRCSRDWSSDVCSSDLLEPDAGGALRVHLARRSGNLRLPPESLTPSQTAIQLALKQQSPVITEDLAQADMDLQGAQSIVAQRLRAVDRKSVV